jgi:hypothetical protein
MKSPTIAQVLHTAKNLYKKERVYYSFIKTKNEQRGLANMRLNRIHIYYNHRINPHLLASICLHEMCHIWCLRRGIYPTYHRDTRCKTIKDYQNYLRTAFRAECYVDNMAHKNIQQFFPGIRFIYGYKNKRKVKWFKTEHLQQVRDILECLKISKIPY